MKLIIDIDEHSYELIKRKVENERYQDGYWRNIADGVPVPERTTGEWIPDEYGDKFRCNVCNQTAYPYQTDVMSDNMWKPPFCPHCGKKMENSEKAYLV